MKYYIGYDETANDENSRADYGVKGMKWGVRRARKRAGSTIRKAGKTTREDVKKFFLGDESTSLLYKKGRANLKSEITNLLKRANKKVAVAAAKDAINDSRKMEKSFKKKGDDAKAQADLNREEANIYLTDAKNIASKAKAVRQKKASQLRDMAALTRKEADIYDREGDALIKKGGMLNNIRGKSKKATAQAMRKEADGDDRKADKLENDSRSGTIERARISDKKATASQLLKEAATYDNRAKEMYSMSEAYGQEAKAFSDWLEKNHGVKHSALEEVVEPEELGELIADAYFSHYGVKGMKWGVRRDDPSGSKITMSDDDLRKVVQRMQLEKQYKELVSSSQSRGVIERGVSEVGSIIGESTRAVIKTTLIRQGTKALNGVLDDLKTS